MTDREMTEVGDFFVCALKKALGDGTAVYNYDDPGDFDRLWQLGECSTNCAGGGHVVIVWDGRSRPIETGDEASAENGGSDGGQDGQPATPGKTEASELAEHLTPLDWALVHSINTLGQDKVPEDADLAIRIVDLTGKDHDEWAFRWRDSLLARMPWVTLHAPLIPSASAKPAAYRAGYHSILGKKGEEPLLDCDGGTWKLTECPTLASSGNSHVVKSLRELVESWAATATRTRDHHDLSNIVGPWILVEAESNDRWIDAFLQKMKWSGLSVDSAERGFSGASNETGSEESVSAEPVGAGAVCYNVLAIDDMLSRGWDKVILKIFGATGNVEVIDYPQLQQICDGAGTPHIFSSAAADVLLDALGWRDGSEADCAKYRRRCFDSPIPDQDGIPWMLVLDLMLFSGHTSPERDWIKELLKVAEKVSDIPKHCLAWDGFSKRELVEVRSWLEASGSRNDPRYETALSLLPRLCALRWPAVPTLLFSATGRRGLIAGLVEKYANVFDAPSKPNLLAGDIRENADAYYAGWRERVAEAQGLISVQKKLIQLMSGSEAATSGIVGDSPCAASDNGNAVEGANDQQHGQPAHGNANHRHLTIAFDESGNFTTDRFSAIGGVIIDATGDNENEAKRSTFGFLEALRANGVNFYDHPPVYTEILDDQCRFEVGRLAYYRDNYYQLKNKNGPICDDIRRTLECHEDLKIVSFRCLMGNNLYEGAGSPDGVYLRWLARTLELVLCEFLPSLGYRQRNTTLSIWLPTRSIEGTPELEPELAQQLAQQFDLYCRPGDTRVQTVGGHSVALEIVHRALEGRPNAEEVLKKCHLKTRKIPYFYTGDNDQRYESALHWCCRTCKVITPPLSSRPRFQPQNMGNPTMTQVEFSTEQENYSLYDAAGAMVRADNGRHVTCNNCNVSYIPADYSVAQHLADAGLTNSLNKFPSSEIETPNRENIDCSISFDVTAGDEMEYFLSAGRSFDRKRTFEGFEKCFRHNWFQDWLKPRNCLTAPIGGRILTECQEHARSIQGSEIDSLAHLNL